MRVQVELLTVLLSVSVLTLTPQKDLVTEPDVADYGHKYYSGYLSPSVTQQVHYVFFESQNNPSKDPLLLCLAGRQGRSILTSLFRQNGPFIFIPGSQKLTMNQNAWNKRANMLYLDLPAGVGFSSDSDDRQVFDDQKTAEEAWLSLKLFYQRFPEHRGKQLNLVGYGYGSMYLTNLAKRIIEQNDNYQLTAEARINLKGLFLGNPCVMEEQCYCLLQRNTFFHYEFLYKRGFLSPVQYDRFVADCIRGNDTYECYLCRQQLDQNIRKANISLFNVYDKCYKDDSGCEDLTGTKHYLNNKTFQLNWHIGDKIWKDFDDRVFDSYIQRGNGYQLMEYLITKKLRLWVYSGDFDSSIPIIGTKKWILLLKQDHQLAVKIPWRRWWVPGMHRGEEQVGGFVWQIDGLIFTSVKGAGMRAALDKPKSMTILLNAFIDGTSLPDKLNSTKTLELM